jgi:hypothetical protein
MFEKALVYLEGEKGGLDRLMLGIAYAILAVVQELVVIEGELRELREALQQHELGRS